jgi:hypothetical protein
MTCECGYKNAKNKKYGMFVFITGRKVVWIFQ